MNSTERTHFGQILCKSSEPECSIAHASKHFIVVELARSDPDLLTRSLLRRLGELRFGAHRRQYELRLLRSRNDVIALLVAQKAFPFEYSWRYYCVCFGVNSERTTSKQISLDSVRTFTNRSAV
jgi:hypothetical protein